MSPALELARTHLADLREELAAAIENGIAGNPPTRPTSSRRWPSPRPPTSPPR